jgi:multidrug efflux pump subunit AcrA (membrane-fusion protein)
MAHAIRNLPAVILVCLSAVPEAFAASPVEISQSEQRPVVQIVTVSGTVTSPQSAVLSPSIGGLVEDTLVDAGDRVEAGSIVVTLDSELARLNLDRVAAERAQAQIALEDSRRRLAASRKPRSSPCGRKSRAMKRRWRRRQQRPASSRRLCAGTKSARRSKAS